MKLLMVALAVLLSGCSDTEEFKSEWCREYSTGQTRTYKESKCQQMGKNPCGVTIVETVKDRQYKVTCNKVKWVEVARHDVR